MRAPDGFDMTAVAERAAVVQASLFDDVVHVVDEFGPAIPTRLNIAGGTDVVVGARDMRAVRCPALGYVSRYLVATLFQQREAQPSQKRKVAHVVRKHKEVAPTNPSGFDAYGYAQEPRRFNQYPSFFFGR